MASVVVLCGGLGTRMGTLGQRRQKTMCEVWGKPLLELVLSHICPGVPDLATPVALLTGHRADDIDEAVSGWQQRIDPRIHAVRQHGPGAAGVMHLAERLPAPVLIIAGNVLLDYSTVLHQWHHDQRPIAAGHPSWRTTNHHTMTAEGTTITSWHRVPHREVGRYEVVDTYLVTPEVLAAMRVHNLSHTRALAALVPHGAVAFHEVTGDWLHIETPADLAVDVSRKDMLCRPPAPHLSLSPARPVQGNPHSPTASPLD